VRLRWVCVVCVTVALMWACTMWAGAQPNTGEGTPPADAAIEAPGIDVEGTITGLADRGVATNDPSLVLAAAEVRLAVERAMRARGLEVGDEEGAEPVEVEAVEGKDQMSYGARELISLAADIAVATGQTEVGEMVAELAENATIGLGDADLAAEIRQRLETGARGTYSGRTTASGWLGPGQSRTWHTTFLAGEYARVDVYGHGGGDVDLYVYDENWVEIDYDNDSTNWCICEWYPRWTGVFYMKVVNYSSYYGISYDLVTN